MKVDLILGSAGCGKTTYLLNQVDEFIKSGIRPDAIAYLSFTKKAAEEAIERACAKFNLHKQSFPYFRTIHSLAYSLAEFRKNEIMHPRNWEDFCNEFGYELNTNILMTDCPSYLAHGDMCLIIYTLAKVKKQSVEEIWREKAYDDLPLDTALLFFNQIEKYKSRRGLYDYCDFLEHYKKKISPQVLIVDEAQDLTRQQWDFIREVCRPQQQVLIAGDDDQAIYEWSGADLETFMGFKAQKIVLPHTYRLPQKIFDLSQGVVQKITRRFDKEITCRAEIGNIQYISNFEELDILHGTWLMLARNKSKLEAYEEYCRAVGVVYWLNGQWSNEINEIKAVLLYESLRAGKELNITQINQIIDYISGMQPVKKETIKYTYDTVPWPFTGKPNWMNALTGISPAVSSYIRELRRNNESLIGQGRIKISTIHAAKGGEADNVLLNTEAGKRIVKHAHKSVRDMDAEMRVWFVAITRAKQALFLYGTESQFV